MVGNQISGDLFEYGDVGPERGDADVSGVEAGATVEPVRNVDVDYSALIEEIRVAAIAWRAKNGRHRFGGFRWEWQGKSLIKLAWMAKDGGEPHTD
jgi:hypothetical protein